MISPERWSELYAIESRPGEDMYGLGVGHLVLPSGQLIAVAQNDDETAVALVRAVWAEWERTFA